MVLCVLSCFFNLTSTLLTLCAFASTFTNAFSYAFASVLDHLPAPLSSFTLSLYFELVTFSLYPFTLPWALFSLQVSPFTLHPSTPSCITLTFASLLPFHLSPLASLTLPFGCYHSCSSNLKSTSILHYFDLWLPFTLSCSYLHSC